MSNRLFQGVIHQMKDTIDRTIGVIDENGIIIACSELAKIGEARLGVRDEIIYSVSPEVYRKNGVTYRSIGTVTLNWFQQLQSQLSGYQKSQEL